MLEYILFSVFCLLCGIYISHKMQFFGKNKAPGPKGWPYFGVVFEVKIATLHLTLYDWAKQYGDVFQFNMLGKILLYKFCRCFKRYFSKRTKCNYNCKQAPDFHRKVQLVELRRCWVCFSKPSLDQASKAHLSTASCLWGRLDFLREADSEKSSNTKG